VRFVGLKGYVTNIPANVMGTGEVIASYHDLWHVEQSFRMSKTDLRARPMSCRRRHEIGRAFRSDLVIRKDTSIFQRS
jgi:hypothetical protein